MDNIIKKIILAIIKINCNKYGRKSRESDEHFLDVFTIFLKDFTKWKCLDYCTFSKFTSDNYRKKFIYWVKCNVFRDAFDVVSEIIKSNLINEKNVNCFIDATNIRNINGSYKRNIDKEGNTLLGRLYCDKFKRCLKITLLITDKNYLLDVIISNGGKHDITVIPSIYENLIKNFKSNKKNRISIVGDKGYASTKIKKQFVKKKMHYIYPNKKNRVNFDNLTYFNTSLLKKRHLVENFISHIKQFTRIRFMYEKLTCIYEGFLLMAILIKV